MSGESFAVSAREVVIGCVLSEHRELKLEQACAKS